MIRIVFLTLLGIGSPILIQGRKELKERGNERNGDEPSKKGKRSLNKFCQRF
jgi:hypothetical protein